MNYTPRTIGFLQALGLALYVGTFATTVKFITAWLSSHAEGPDNQILSISLFLLTFMTSALICASIALAYPIRMYTAGQKREALSVVLWTIVGLAITLICVVVTLVAL